MPVTLLRRCLGTIAEVFTRGYCLCQFPEKRNTKSNFLNQYSNPMRKIATTTNSAARQDGTKTFSKVGWAISFFILLMLNLLSNTTLAQCTLVCNSGVNISLPGPDSNCQVMVTPEMLFEPPICPNPMSVQLLDDLGRVRSNSPLVTLADVGKTIMYRVWEGNNYCMGNLKVYDKLPPRLINCRDTTVHCLEDTRPDSLGGAIPSPTASDCSSFTLNYQDVVTKGTCLSPFLMTIARRWTATDIRGFSSSCIQTITISRLSLIGPPPIIPVCPPNRDLTCNLSSQPSTHPDSTGYPQITVNSVTYDIKPGASHLCEFAATYSDEVFPLCGGSKKIFRTWSVFDWCHPNTPGVNPWTCIQVIKVLDATPPVVTCPPAITLGTTNGTCFGTANLLPATITDACSNFTVQTLTQFGSLNTNGGSLPNFPKGTHTVTYVATDACGNVGNCSTTVTIVDNTPPVAVCIQYSVVALTREGTTSVQASAFSNGSSDNCGLGKFEVRRMANSCAPASDFGPTVSFTCCDIGTKITIVLRVYDTENSFNECMVEVTVQDKVNPTISQCPPNLVLECGTPLPAPIPPIYFDNCQQGINWTFKDVSNINTCGIGTITRTHTVTDASGLTASCVQLITIQNSTPLRAIDITWPPAYTISQCGTSTKPEDLPAPYNRPRFTEDPCDIIAVTHTDQVLPTSPPSCFRILRKWIVIDWCRYDANNPLLNDTYFEYVQVLEVRDNVAPTINCPADITVLNYDAKCGPVPVVVPPATAQDCSSSLTWTTSIDLFSNGTTDQIIPSPNASGNYPAGVHTITITVLDQCGNSNNCTFKITVKDGKAPTPVCYHGIAAELMADPSGDGGMVTLTPDMFNSGSYDNCTPPSLLKFSLSKTIFTCANKGHNSILLYVTDEAGNTDFCETYVLIQDNLSVCPSGRTADVAGAITSTSGAALQSVVVSVSGTNAPTTTATTSKTGQFVFTGLATGKDYTFTPSYNMQPLNGVSTYDLVLITRHILNIESLDSPYKMIAADVNKSGTVTTADVVEIRRLILGMTQNFPNNTSWRFVPKSFAFANPSNPLQSAFPELYNVNNLSNGMNNVDFVAIKTGDVNSSAVMSNLSEAVEQRTGSVDLQVSEQIILKGDVIRVPVSIAQFNQLAGYQFAMQFNTDALELMDIEYVNAPREYFGLNELENGIIRTSWDNSKNNTLDAMASQHNTTLFALIFRAKTNSTISKQLSIANHIIDAEAYLKGKNELSISALNLQFSKMDVAAGFELFQNTPNPYTDKTIIGFILPEASQTTLTIYDLSGKVLKSVSKASEAGYNQIVVNSRELPAAGVLFYKLETPANNATKRMVRIQ